MADFSGGQNSAVHQSAPEAVGGESNGKCPVSRHTSPAVPTVVAAELPASASPAGASVNSSDTQPVAATNADEPKAKVRLTATQRKQVIASLSRSKAENGKLACPPPPARRARSPAAPSGPKPAILTASQSSDGAQEKTSASMSKASTDILPSGSVTVSQEKKRAVMGSLLQAMRRSGDSSSPTSAASAELKSETSAADKASQSYSPSKAIGVVSVVAANPLQRTPASTAVSNTGTTGPAGAKRPTGQAQQDKPTPASNTAAHLKPPQRPLAAAHNATPTDAASDHSHDRPHAASANTQPSSSSSSSHCNDVAAVSSSPVPGGTGSSQLHAKSNSTATTTASGGGKQRGKGEKITPLTQLPDKQRSNTAYSTEALKPQRAEIEIVRASWWSAWSRCLQLTCILSIMVMGVLGISVVCMVGSMFSVDFAAENLVNSTSVLVGEETQRWSLELGLWGELQGRAWARSKAGMLEVSALHALSAAASAESTVADAADATRQGAFAAWPPLATPGSAGDLLKSRMRSLRLGLVAELWRRGDAVWGEVLDLQSGAMLGASRAPPVADDGGWGGDGWLSTVSLVAPVDNSGGAAPAQAAAQRAFWANTAPLQSAVLRDQAWSVPATSTGSNCMCSGTEEWAPPAPFGYSVASPRGAGVFSTLLSDEFRQQRWGGASASHPTAPSWWWRAAASVPPSVVTAAFMCSNDDARQPWSHLPVWMHGALLEGFPFRLNAASALAAASSSSFLLGAFGSAEANDDPMYTARLRAHLQNMGNSSVPAGAASGTSIRAILQAAVKSAPPHTRRSSGVSQTGCTCAAPSSGAGAGADWLKAAIAQRPYLAAMVRPEDAAVTHDCSSDGAHSTHALPPVHWSLHRRSEIRRWRQAPPAVSPAGTAGADDLLAVLSIRTRVPSDQSAAMAPAELLEASLSLPAGQCLSSDAVIVSSLAVPLAVLMDRVNTVSGQSTSLYVHSVTAARATPTDSNEDSGMCVGLSTGNLPSAIQTADTASPAHAGTIDQLLGATAVSGGATVRLGQGSPDPAHGLTLDPSAAQQLWNSSVGHSQRLNSDSQGRLSSLGTLGALIGQAAEALLTSPAFASDEVATQRSAALAAQPSAGVGLRPAMSSQGVVDGQFTPLGACSAQVMQSARQRIRGASRWGLAPDQNAALAGEGSIASPYSRSVLVSALQSEVPALFRFPWQDAEQADRMASSLPLARDAAYTAAAVSRANAATWWAGASDVTASGAGAAAAFAQLDAEADTPSAAWADWVQRSACAYTAFASTARGTPTSDFPVPGTALGDVAFCDQAGVLQQPAAPGDAMRDSVFLPPWSVVVALPRNAFSSFLWFPILVPSLLTLVIVLSTGLIVAQLKQKAFTHCAAGIRDRCGCAKKGGGGGGGGTANHKDYLVNGKAKKKEKQKGSAKAGRAWMAAMLDRMAQELAATSPEDDAALASDGGLADGPQRVARAGADDAPLTRPRRMSMLEQHPEVSRRVSVSVSKSGKAQLQVINTSRDSVTRRPTAGSRPMSPAARRASVASSRSSAPSLRRMSMMSSNSLAVTELAASELDEEEDETMGGEGIGRVTLIVMGLTFVLVLLVYLQWTSAWNSAVNNLNTAVMEVQGYRAVRAVRWLSTTSVQLHAQVQRMLAMTAPAQAPATAQGLSATLLAAATGLQIAAPASVFSQPPLAGVRAGAVAGTPPWSPAAVLASLSSLGSSAAAFPAVCLNGTSGAPGTGSTTGMQTLLGDASCQAALDGLIHGSVGGVVGAPFNASALQAAQRLRGSAAVSDSSGGAGLPAADLRALHALLSAHARSNAAAQALLDVGAAHLRVGQVLPASLTITHLHSGAPSVASSATLFGSGDGSGTEGAAVDGSSVTLHAVRSVTSLAAQSGTTSREVSVPGGALILRVLDGAVHSAGAAVAPASMLLQSAHVPLVTATDAAAAYAQASAGTVVMQRTTAHQGSASTSLASAQSAAGFSTSSLVFGLAVLHGSTPSAVFPTPLASSNATHVGLPAPSALRLNKLRTAVYGSAAGHLGVAASTQLYRTAAGRARSGQSWFRGASDTPLQRYGAHGSSAGAAAELSLARVRPTTAGAMCAGDAATLPGTWAAAAATPSSHNPMHASTAAVLAAGDVDVPQWGVVASLDPATQAAAAAAGALPGTVRRSSFVQGSVSVVSRVQAGGATGFRSAPGSAGNATVFPAFAVSVGGAALLSPSQQAGITASSRVGGALGSGMQAFSVNPGSANAAGLYRGASLELQASAAALHSTDWLSVGAADIGGVFDSASSALTDATYAGLSGQESAHSSGSLSASGAITLQALAAASGSLRPAMASLHAAVDSGAAEVCRAWGACAPGPTSPQGVALRRSDGNVTVVSLGRDAQDVATLGWSTLASQTLPAGLLQAAASARGVAVLSSGDVTTLTGMPPPAVLAGESIARHLRAIPARAATSSVLASLPTAPSTAQRAAAALLLTSGHAASDWWPAAPPATPLSGAVIASDLTLGQLAGTAAAATPVLNAHPHNLLYGRIPRGEICANIISTQCVTPEQRLAAVQLATSNDASLSAAARAAGEAATGLPPGNRVLITEGRQRLARSIASRSVSLRRLLAFSLAVPTTQAANTLASRFTGSMASALVLASADTAMLGSGAVLSSLSSGLASSESARSIAEALATQQFFGGESHVPADPRRSDDSAEGGLYASDSATLWLPHTFYSLESLAAAIEAQSPTPYSSFDAEDSGMDRVQALVPLLAPGGLGRPLPSLLETASATDSGEGSGQTRRLQSIDASSSSAALFTDTSASRGGGYILTPPGLLVAASHGAGTSFDGATGALQRLTPPESDDVYIASVGGVFGMSSAGLNVSAGQSIASRAQGRGGPFIATGGLGPRRALVLSDALVGTSYSDIARVNTELTAAFTHLSAIWTAGTTGSDPVSDTPLSAVAVAGAGGFSASAAAAALDDVVGGAVQQRPSGSDSDTYHGGLLLSQLQIWAASAAAFLATHDWQAASVGGNFDMVVHSTLHRYPLNAESQLWANIAFIIAVGAILMTVVLTSSVTTALSSATRKARQLRIMAQLEAVKAALRKVQALPKSDAKSNAISAGLAVLGGGRDAGQDKTAAAGRDRALSKTLLAVRKDQAAATVNQAYADAKRSTRNSQAAAKPGGAAADRSNTTDPLPPPSPSEHTSVPNPLAASAPAPALTVARASGSAPASGGGGKRRMSKMATKVHAVMKLYRQSKAAGGSPDSALRGLRGPTSPGFTPLGVLEEGEGGAEAAPLPASARRSSRTRRGSSSRSRRGSASSNGSGSGAAAAPDSKAGPGLAAAKLRRATASLMAANRLARAGGGGSIAASRSSVASTGRGSIAPAARVATASSAAGRPPTFGAPAAAPGVTPGATQETSEEFNIGIWTTFNMLYPVVRGIVMEGSPWDRYRSRVAAAAQKTKTTAPAQRTAMNPIAAKSPGAKSSVSVSVLDAAQGGAGGQHGATQSGSASTGPMVDNPLNSRQQKDAMAKRKTAVVKPLSSREQTLFRRARQFIHYYVSDAHPLETLYFEATSRWSREFANRVVSTVSYQMGVAVFLVLFLLLAFWEAGPTASLAGTIPLSTPASAVGVAGDVVVGIPGVSTVSSAADLPLGVSTDGAVGQGNVLFAVDADSLVTLGSALQPGTAATASAGTGMATLRVRTFGASEADNGLVSGWFVQQAYAWTFAVLDRGAWGGPAEAAAKDNKVPIELLQRGSLDSSQPYLGNGIDRFGIQREDQWLRAGVLRVELLCLLVFLADTVLLWYSRGIRRHYVRLFDAAAPWTRRYQRWQRLHGGGAGDASGAPTFVTGAAAASQATAMMGDDDEDATDEAIGNCLGKVADFAYGVFTCGARRRRKYAYGIRDGDGQRSVESKKREGKMRTLFLARIILLVLFLGDWLFRVFVGYRTGRTSTLLPITAILRPLFIVARVTSLRSALASFASTLILARRVLALFASFLVVASGISIALLSSRADLRFPVFSGDEAAAAASAAASGSSGDATASASSDDATFTVSSLDSGSVSVSALSALTSAGASALGAVAAGFQGAAALPAVVSEEGDGVGRGFSEFQASWISTFVLATTGENYNEVVYRASDSSAAAGGRLAVLFKPLFIVISFIGLYILVSLLIAHFQARFSESEARARESRTQKRRLALVLAYSLLDDDGSGSLERVEYTRFLAHAGVKNEHYDRLPDRLGPPEFVHLCEFLMLKKHFNFGTGEYASERFVLTLVSRRMEDGLRKLALLGCVLRSRSWLRRFFNNELDVKWDSFILGLVILNTWAVCLFGTKLAPLVDSVTPLFVSVYGAELLLRVTAVGYKRFWYGKKKKTRQVVSAQSDPALAAAALSKQKSALAMDGTSGAVRRHPSMVSMPSGHSLHRLSSTASMGGLSNGAASESGSGNAQNEAEVKVAPFQTAANRFDAVVIVATIVVALVSAFVSPSGSDDSSTTTTASLAALNGVARLSMVLPVLRLFSVVHTTRALVFGLLSQAHKFLAILAVLILVMYVFAVLGCWSFAGLLRDLPPSVVSSILRNANFDTFESSMSTLYGVMLAEGWQEILYALIDAGNSINAAFYFIMYVTIVSVLFSQVFVGITIDVYLAVEREQREGDEDVDEGFAQFLAAYGDQIDDDDDEEDDVEAILAALKAMDSEDSDQSASSGEEEDVVTLVHRSPSHRKQ